MLGYSPLVESYHYCFASKLTRALEARDSRQIKELIAELKRLVAAHHVKISALRSRLGSPLTPAVMIPHYAQTLFEMNEHFHYLFGHYVVRLACFDSGLWIHRMPECQKVGAAWRYFGLK